MNFFRFLPGQKWQRRLAERGIDHERLFTFPVVRIGRDECILARLLPPTWAELKPEWDGLLLVEHVWRPYPATIRAVCPVETHAPLLQSRGQTGKGCPACEAGVPTVAHVLFHASIERNGAAHGVVIKFHVRDFATVQQIIDTGAISFEKGRKVELRREGWNLHYRLCASDPVDKAEFETFTEGCELNTYLCPVKTELLQFMADAIAGWNKAGQPEPDANQHKELVKLLPGTILLDIPWGFKAPQRFGWRETPHSVMSKWDYMVTLDRGNIGILCGIMPDKTCVLIGLDADTDEFAAKLGELNVWLTTTFCVQGKRGKKWFFLVRPNNDAALAAIAQSTKIKRGECDIGDWLGEGKQGVIFGLHPSGCFYQHNGLSLATISPDQFVLPDDCRFSRSPKARPIFRDGEWVRDRSIRSASVRVIQSALNYIAPDERDTWFTVGCALRTWGFERGNDQLARELWDKWSAKSRKFDEGGQEKLWASLARRESGAITTGSLFWLAQQGGWKNDENDEEADEDE